MQYNRRREEGQRLESGSDLFRRNRRDDRSPRRNMSPLEIDGMKRVGGNKGSSNEFKGRDYHWHEQQHVGGGRRNAMVRSRSPLTESVRKRSHFDDGVVHNRSCSPPPPSQGLRARYELSKTMDENLDAKGVYLSREMAESRLGGMFDQKFVVHENEVGGSFRYRSITSDMGENITTRYEEVGGHLPPPLPSRGVPAGRFERERAQHRDGPPVVKRSITGSQGGTEKTIIHERNVSYSGVSPSYAPSYAKDFADSSHMRDYGGSSIDMSRGDFLCSHGDGMCLATSYDLPRSSRKLAEPAGFSRHGQRTVIETARAAEIGPRNMTCHQLCEFSPARNEHEDHHSYKLQARATAQEYHYDDLPGRIAPHRGLDYEQAVMEYDNREYSRPHISHPDLNRTTVKSDDSYVNQRRAIVHDHPALQKAKCFDYHDVRRTSIASMQGEGYSRSGYNHLENGKRMQQHYDVSHMGAPEADRLPIIRTEYESLPGLQQERFQSLPLSKHNSGIQRQAFRVQEQDRDIHDHPDRPMKRKYSANDEIDVHELRTIKPSKQGGTEEFQDEYEIEDWIEEEDMDTLYGNDEYNSKIHGKCRREYDELENEDFPSDEWTLPQHSMGHVQRHPFLFHKYSNQNIKHHSKSSSSNWYKPQHFSRRNAVQKQPKVWKKHHGYDENKHAANDESSEDWISVAESEPTEGSEEFNQMVHENFLMYSKKLNLNLYVQRRYQDQGKAGSLYCIVCGRSSSKEFMDTQRLVTHAFMSHKAGLRTKHLGLHKAICVLMGWDTVVPQETVTWVPQVLPPAEALAQKEDLIIWPPIVIIHNISMSDDNPQNWKVVSMETIEAFLRGKGFVSGRIKLCLGKPADQSVILVKFLGTFGGLGDAERLHRYLSGNSRGRAEYQRGGKSESIKSLDTSDNGDKVETILYGYLGIADDLDKLDFNSKKWSMVKSRKEIDDLDKAPVKTDERR